MAFSSESFLDIDKTSPPKVRGFRFAGIAAGIKSNGKPDLGVIVADEDVAAAGVYTKNRVRAAPVEIVLAISRGPAGAAASRSSATRVLGSGVVTGRARSEQLARAARLTRSEIVTGRSMRGRRVHRAPRQRDASTNCAPK